MVSIVDNYDSFTYNLVDLVAQTDAPFRVFRNNEVDWEYLKASTHWLLSPGPGLPSQSGQLMHILDCKRREQSVLGVCLGMQALLMKDGAEITNLKRVQHGAMEQLDAFSTDSVLFSQMQGPITAGRYHSWGFLKQHVGKPWKITAMSSDGFVMAVEDKNDNRFGVQFHPESIMSNCGRQLIKNWLDH